MAASDLPAHRVECRVCPCLCSGHTAARAMLAFVLGHDQSCEGRKLSPIITTLEPAELVRAARGVK